MWKIMLDVHYRLGKLESRQMILTALVLGALGTIIAKVFAG